MLTHKRQVSRHHRPEAGQSTQRGSLFNALFVARNLPVVPGMRQDKTRKTKHLSGVALWMLAIGCRVPCDPATFLSRCDGEEEVSCKAGLESSRECEGACDQALGFCSICGDGFVSPGEACDDGNRIELDFCETSCRFVAASCGDGFVQNTEECDDGRQCDDGTACTFDNECSVGVCETHDRDGCNADCSLQACENGRQDPGDFCFEPQTILPAGGSSSAVLRDIDGDSDLDLIAMQGGFAIFRNNGAGVFSQPTLIAAQTNGAFEVGDLDGDNDLDLVTGNSLLDLDPNGDCCIDQGQLSLFFNLGDGTFGAPVLLPGGLRAAKLFDFDGDGDLDLAKSDFPRMRVLLNDGAGVFNSEITIDSPLVDGGINRIDAADLNGDATPDLVLQLNGPGAAAVLLNQNGLSLAEPTIIDLSTGTLNLVVGDVDGDGDNDIITAPLRILFNDGEMIFRSVASSDGPFSLSALLDVDGDALLDFVDPSFVSLHIGEQADGTLQTSQHLYSPSSDAFAVGDVDGDGLGDIVKTGARDESTNTSGLQVLLMRP